MPWCVSIEGRLWKAPSAYALGANYTSSRSEPLDIDMWWDA